MNAFDACRQVEKCGMEDIIKFLRMHAHEGQFVLTDKGTLAMELQKSVGDALLNTEDGRAWGVEVKIEEENKHGNFFLETWSNLSRHTPGWMFTLRSDLLLYYFKKEGELYCMRLDSVKRWAFTERNIYKFPERAQAKYDQKNDTWGRCVPIEIIRTEVGFKKYWMHEPTPEQVREYPSNLFGGGSNG